jgi:hypothetical protein
MTYTSIEISSNPYSYQNQTASNESPVIRPRTIPQTCKEGFRLELQTNPWTLAQLGKIDKYSNKSILELQLQSALQLKAKIDYEMGLVMETRQSLEQKYYPGVENPNILSVDGVKSPQYRVYKKYLNGEFKTLTADDTKILLQAFNRYEAFFFPAVAHLKDGDINDFIGDLQDQIEIEKSKGKGINQSSAEFANTHPICVPDNSFRPDRIKATSLQPLQRLRKHAQQLANSFEGTHLPASIFKGA